MGVILFGARRFPVAPNGARHAGGASDLGRIVRLSTGQCHGTIRMANGRQVWFHRGDMCEPTRFNELVVGDSVAFELREDRVSGARALLVRRKQAGRRP